MRREPQFIGKQNHEMATTKFFIQQHAKIDTVNAIPKGGILHEKQNHAIQQARVGPTAHANAYTFPMHLLHPWLLMKSLKNHLP